MKGYCKKCGKVIDEVERMQTGKPLCYDCAVANIIGSDIDRALRQIKQTPNTNQ